MIFSKATEYFKLPQELDADKFTKHPLLDYHLPKKLSDLTCLRNSYVILIFSSDLFLYFSLRLFVTISFTRRKVACISPALITTYTHVYITSLN